jgi:hypothetical protein
MAVFACVPSGADARTEDVPDLQAFTSDYASSQGGAAPLFAIRPPNIFTHNVGLLQLQITNIGMIGNFFINNFSAGWRGGEYLFAAGLWVGAKRGDGIPHVTTAVYDLEFLPPPDPEWTVYEAFEGIQGGNRLGFSSGPQDEVGPGVGDIVTSGANDDWNGGADGRIDEDFLNGLDDDGDGQVDEDFEAIAQQMFSTQYWDISEFTQESEPDHVPLDLLVRQRSFAWATAGTNEFVGFDFEVYNIGNETLNDVFIAFFVDGDAGPKDKQNYWVDDKFGFVAGDTTIVNDAAPVGCQTTQVDYSIAYIFDTPDIEINEESGGVRGGDVPGYFGGMFLGHTTDPLGVDAPPQVAIRLARSFSGSEPYPQGDPRNDSERYELISSQGTPTRPETIKEADYRYVIAAGPFRSLPPDTSLNFQTAFVIGEGRSGMIENAVQAQLIFDGVWRDADANDQTGSLGRETCIRPPGNATSANWDNPCDSLTTQIPIEWPGYCAPENYVDNDCDNCTPLATESDPGPETLINWVGTVAPPPPATNSDCDRVDVGVSPEGDRRVVLQWDNLSELKADPIQRRILFEGYRIWRVEGWRRPVGSTGPAPEDWQLLGQIVKNPVDPPQRCFVTDPRTGEKVPFEFNVRSFLGNWEPNDPAGILPDDPCEACPQFCWPQRLFRVNELLAPVETGIATGDTTPGQGFADLYPVGFYTYVDTAGIKNGMIYFYDITAFSAWEQITYDNSTVPPTEIIRNFELSGRPAARECQMVVPTWPTRDTKDEIYVVPNPYVQGDRTVLPWGWDLIPSDQDPTGTRLAFTNLPAGRNVIKIYTLAGDLVETIDMRATGENGTAFWNLVSRNGQDVVAGVYLFTVVTENQGTKVGRFVVIR